MTFTALSRSKPSRPGPMRRPRQARRAAGSVPGFIGFAPRLGATTSLHPPGLQTKLEVGAPNNRFEQEADRVAEQVMRMPEPYATGRTTSLQLKPGGRIQRLCAECEHELHRQAAGEEEEEEVLQAREENGRARPGVASNLESRVRSLKGGGQPLPRDVRTFFEPRYGVDFGRVRVHTNARSSELARAVNARAFTVGHDVVFGQGRYSPATTSGKRLIAHELTHVVQQQTGCPGCVQRQTLGEPSLGRSTNYAFDTYNVTQGHLSDPDIIARFDMLSVEQLIDYRDRVADPSVQSYIDRLIASRTPALLRVEVDPGSRNHFPSVPGTGPGTHWVGVASRTARKPRVRAVVTPAVSPTDPLVAGLTWSGPGVAPDPTNPLEAVVDRTAGRRRVTATLRGISESTTLWSVFARVAANGAPVVRTNTDATRFRADADVRFAATILPQSIITDADHPDLSGARNVAPPDNGTQICGNALAGGADRLWDISRRTRQHVINSAGLVPTPAADACLWSNIGYPAILVEGNDDTHTGDENNDPYAGGGVLTSHDTPGDFIRHTNGADGDTLEVRIQFQEFARLELNRGWWRISALVPWRFHIRTRKDPATHSWVDDGTDAALDNTGF